MLESLKIEANKTFTENGAVTYKTTYSNNLDLFSTIGALRQVGEEEIIRRFKKAFIEDTDLAMKNLFFARDVRGGLGERRTFRICLKWLAGYRKESVTRNLEMIAEYGRFDDLLSLLGTPCEKEVIECIGQYLNKDVEAMKQNRPVSLLAKWLPSVNTSNRESVATAKKLARALSLRDAEYRKTLSALRNHIKLIENNLREKDYTFDYSKQPSKAMFKYRNAFIRNDNERYLDFLNSVKCGKAKIHTGTLMPYEIIRPATDWWAEEELSRDERLAMDVSWKELEDFSSEDNALVVIDGSGSMYGCANPQPAAVALSLGIYFAEKNKGAYKNHFITFSNNPQLVEIKGEDIVDKVMYCKEFNEVADTNLQKVFELVLSAAVKNKLPQEELPKTIYIVSDMEFNYCTRDAGLTNFQYAKKLFDMHGYQLPQIVFWNVCSRNVQQPVKMNEQGVVLVSGCTPRLFSMIASGQYSPYDFMMSVLGSERYSPIAA